MAATTRDDPRARRALLQGSAALLLMPSLAAARRADGFDPRAAWAEFAELLRMRYAYFERDGVDGEGILRHFEAVALTATSRERFVAVLKRAARNFADPHFNVGPWTPGDPQLVPTGSDLHVGLVGDQVLVAAVRAGSDAARQGIAPGSAVVDVNGVPVRVAAERILGRPLASLSRLQIDHGLNLALAGSGTAPRRLTSQSGGVERPLSLRPTTELARRVAASAPVNVRRDGDLAVVRFDNSLGRLETIRAFRAALPSLLDASTFVIDLRNTPSGGNTTVARGIMGHFVRSEMPYQLHVVPEEARRHGAPRKFMEYVLPAAPYYPGRVFAVGGRWTGSMGEGMMIGFDALGATTVGSPLGHLLGAMENIVLEASGARIEIGTEQLLHVRGTPREAFRPAWFIDPAEASADADACLDAIQARR
ncbi:hypothetical protein [uncultured Methylibium sp.]|uniref:S41 family peptidase n=1 Tax=uncultured Methylibium sp. TaxID=381093 RepID=UPI0025E64000|nr:hypothetical protein [uncultured Methylibium sp.]